MSSYNSKECDDLLDTPWVDLYTNKSDTEQQNYSKIRLNLKYIFCILKET